MAKPHHPFVKSKGQVVRPGGNPTAQIAPTGGGALIDVDQLYLDLLGLFDGMPAEYVEVNVLGIPLALSAVQENWPGKQTGTMNFWKTKAVTAEGVKYPIKQNHLDLLGISRLGPIEFYIITDPAGIKFAVCLSAP